MAEHVDARDPFLYRRIEEHLSISVVHDLYHLEIRLRGSSAVRVPPCATICVAKTYPNDLLLADVAFVNPHKPIAKHRRRFRYQEFEGLGLLPELMRRIIVRARRDRMDRLLLIAAAADLVPLFEKHGLSLDDSDMARSCLESGASIPMQLIIEES